MGFVGGKRPRDALRELVLGEEELGEEERFRQAMLWKYLDLLDFAAMGGVGQIARRTAKRMLVWSMKKELGKQGFGLKSDVGKAVWKLQGKPMVKKAIEALDLTPQRELDPVKKILFGKLPRGELGKYMEGEILLTPEADVLLDTATGEVTSTIQKVREVLLHELGHAGSLQAEARRTRPLSNRVATYAVFDPSIEKKVGYWLSPKEVYARKYAEAVEELSPGVEKYMKRGYKREALLQSLANLAHERAWRRAVTKAVEVAPNETVDALARTLAGLGEATRNEVADELTKLTPGLEQKLLEYLGGE